jgi:hypothetical protein
LLFLLLLLLVADVQFIPHVVHNIREHLPGHSLSLANWIVELQ